MKIHTTTSLEDTSKTLWIGQMQAEQEHCRPKTHSMISFSKSTTTQFGEHDLFYTDFKTVNNTYHTLHSFQPAYLRTSLHACHSTRSLRLSNTNLLSAPFVRTSFGSRSFSFAATKIWNSLPLSLRTCTSPDTFRRHLKTQ